MADFYDAVAQQDGYIVIVDNASPASLAHPPYCPSVQSEHFHEKVVRNKGKSGRYYWASTRQEAREHFGAIPCDCA